MADYKELSEKLSKALDKFNESKRNYENAEFAVNKAKEESQVAFAKLGDAHTAVAELQRSLKAHVEEALGVTHNG